MFQFFHHISFLFNIFDMFLLIIDFIYFNSFDSHCDSVIHIKSSRNSSVRTIPNNFQLFTTNWFLQGTFRIFLLIIKFYFIVFFLLIIKIFDLIITELFMINGEFFFDWILRKPLNLLEILYCCIVFCLFSNFINNLTFKL